jgi:L-2-hydroxyglutarate oxidase LhgO
LANGVTLEQVDLERLHQLEPLARGVGWALWSPTTAVADPVDMGRALAGRAIARGAQIITGAKVTGASGTRVTVNDQVWSIGHLVNASGLYADRVAKWYGLADDYVMIPFKGLYWYGNWAPGRLQRHVYPVPDPRNPFLGVHLTVTPNGGVKLGPTAIPALWREDYSRGRGFRPREMLEIISAYPGFLTSPHHDIPALVRSEVPKYLRRELVRQAAALVPAVRAHDFRVRGAPGVRAQLWNLPQRRLEMDFVVRGDDVSTHMLNVVSPGWTTSLSVAEYLLDELARRGVL